MSKIKIARDSMAGFKPCCLFAVITSDTKQPDTEQELQ